MAFDPEEYEQLPTDENGSMPAIVYLNLLRKFFWISAGVALIYWKRMHWYLLHWQESNLSGSSVFVLGLAGAVVILLIAYLVLVVKRRHGPLALKRWKTYAPGAVKALTFSNIVCFLTAIQLFYPVYGLWTVPMMLVLTMSWINLLTFV